ncbi:MAG: DUF1501 domain-containing protein [Nitrospirae bacterium]|nr:DUF1501 domain-containing protein [Nitrospirota bacterium]
MLTRRRFIADSMTAAGFLLAAPLSGLGSSPAPESSGRRRKVLVVVFQRGGADGLSMVAPHGDPALSRNRPGIGIPKSGDTDWVIDLDGFFGLHPALSPLLPFWRDKRLAIVHAVGSHDPTRSHFEAQDYMENGTPGTKRTPDGWLARALRQEGGNGLRSLALTHNLPLALRGDPTALAFPSLASLAGLGKLRGYETIYGPDERVFEIVERLRALGLSRLPIGDPGASPRSPFGQAMREMSQVIKADAGLRAGFIETAGWDTHVNQGGSRGILANRLKDLAEGLAAFARDLGQKLDDVIVLTMTEFGRTARENGNRGTDHGHGTAFFVLGGDVRGGKVYGRWPGLRPQDLYEGRDLAVTTDFRDVAAALLAGHLGIPNLQTVFPGHAPRHEIATQVLG